jgi:hypothetical protein
MIISFMTFIILLFNILITPVKVGEHAVAQLVEARRYKLEGRGFDSRWCYWQFSST